MAGFILFENFTALYNMLLWQHPVGEPAHGSVIFFGDNMNKEIDLSNLQEDEVVVGKVTL